MEFTINNEDEPKIARHITVAVGNKEFRISVDKFYNLEIVKVYGSDDGSLHITPSVSNVILIT